MTIKPTKISDSTRSQSIEDTISAITSKYGELVQLLIDHRVPGSELDNADDEEKFLKLLQEVLVRFDTNPKLYQKIDFFKLIKLIVFAYKSTNDGYSKDEIDQMIGALQTEIDKCLTDAPSDGNIYGRQNGAWEKINTDGKVKDVKVNNVSVVDDNGIAKIDLSDYATNNYVNGHISVVNKSLAEVNKLIELIVKHLDELSELVKKYETAIDGDTLDSESDANSTYITFTQYNGSLTKHELPQATTESAGYITADDKKQIDKIAGALEAIAELKKADENLAETIDLIKGYLIESITPIYSNDKIEIDFNLGNGKKFQLDIKSATESTAGLMSSEDKKKLDSLTPCDCKVKDIQMEGSSIIDASGVANIIAGEGIIINGNTISATGGQGGGNVDDVRVDGVSVVSDKIAEITLSDRMKNDGSNYEGDATLVTPSISSTWSIESEGNITTSSSANITVEQGSVVEYKGILNKPIITDGYKMPNAMGGPWGSNLSWPSNITDKNIVSNKTYTQTYTSPKSGLIVVNNKVLKATGSDSTSSSASVKFYYKYFYAPIVNYDPDMNFRELNNAYMTSNSMTISKVLFTENVFVIAIPGNAGLITKAVTANFEDITDQFVKQSDVKIPDAGGNDKVYSVYTFKSATPLNVNVDITFKL